MAKSELKNKKLLKDQIFESPNENAADLQIILKSLSYYQIITDKNRFKIAEAISQINNQIEIGPNKALVFSVLHILMDHCSPEELIKNSSYWLSNAFQHVQNQHSESHKTDDKVVEVIGSLIFKIGSNAEVSRNFCQSILPTFITSLMNLSNVKKQEYTTILKLKVLNICMIHLPNLFGAFKTKLERFLIPLLESNNSHLQILTAQCVSKLPGLGGGGATGLHYKEAWTILVKKLISQLNEMVLLTICQNEEDSSNLLAESKSTDLLPPFTAGQLADSKLICCRFVGLATVLNLLMRQTFPSEVSVPVVSILDLVVQIIEAQSNMPSKSSDQGLFSMSLDKTATSGLFQEQAMIILESMILSCGEYLWNRADFIYACLERTLEFVSSDRINSRKNIKNNERIQYIKVKLVTDRCLQSCLSLGILPSSSTVFKNIVRELLDDVKSFAIVDHFNLDESLITTNATGQSSSKKKKQQRYTADVNQLKSISYQNTGNLTSTIAAYSSSCFHNDRIELICQALKVLQLISSSDLSLFANQSKKNSNKEEIEILFPVLHFCHDLLSKINSSVTFYPSPYNNDVCRVELYRLLQSLLGVEVIQTSTISGLIGKILSTAKGDPCMEIRMIAQQTISNLSMSEINKIDRNTQSTVPFSILNGTSATSKKSFSESSTNNDDTFGTFSNLNNEKQRKQQSSVHHDIDRTEEGRENFTLSSSFLLNPTPNFTSDPMSTRNKDGNKLDGGNIINDSSSLSLAGMPPRVDSLSVGVTDTIPAKDERKVRETTAINLAETLSFDKRQNKTNYPRVANENEKLSSAEFSGDSENMLTKRQRMDDGSLFMFGESKTADKIFFLSESVSTIARQRSDEQHGSDGGVLKESKDEFRRMVGDGEGMLIGLTGTSEDNNDGLLSPLGMNNDKRINKINDKRINKFNENESKRRNADKIVKTKDTALVLDLIMGPVDCDKEERRGRKAGVVEEAEEITICSDSENDVDDDMGLIEPDDELNDDDTHTLVRNIKAIDHKSNEQGLVENEELKIMMGTFVDANPDVTIIN